MHGEVRRASHVASVRNSLGPETVVEEPQPTLIFSTGSLAGLEKGFTKGKVFVLDYALSSRVVRRNVNVVDVPALRKVLQCLDHQGPIVCDNLCNMSIAAYDIFP